MPIIDDELIETAMKIATPAIMEILSTPEAIWGPCYVSVVIMLTTKNLRCTAYNKFLGEVTDWRPEWGERADFRKIAEEKATISARTQLDTGGMAYFAPQLFLDGEHLYAGGVSATGISIGVSGAKEFADEGIGQIILATIVMLSKLKVAKKKQKEDYIV